MLSHKHDKWSLERLLSHTHVVTWAASCATFATALLPWLRCTMPSWRPWMWGVTTVRQGCGSCSKTRHITRDADVVSFNARWRKWARLWRRLRVVLLVLLALATLVLGPLLMLAV